MAFPGWQLLRNRVLGNLLGFAAGTAAAAAFTPGMRDVIAEIERAFGLTRRLSPEDLATMVVYGVRDADAAAEEAADWGVSRHRFDELVRITGNPPGLSELLDLWNRGVITEGDVERGIRTGRIRTEWIPDLKRLRDRLLTPAEIADAIARGLGDAGDLEREARAIGLSPERGELLAEVARRPPAIGQLLDLLNRGELSEGEVRTALRDAGIRDRYIDAVVELRRYLLPLSDITRLATHEVYTPRLRQKYRLDEELPDELVSQARRLGISRDDATDLWAGHWGPPSAEQGFAMYHRGIIDRDDVADLLRVHDYVPYWRDRLIELSHRVPGRIDIRRLFILGIITRQELVRGYGRLGYSPEDARRLADAAQRAKLAPERDLTKAELVAGYENGALTRAQAVERLGDLGLDETEAAFVLDLADARRARRRRDAVVAAVKARFLDRELDAGEARARLAAAQVPDTEIGFHLDLWTFQLAENPRHITEAQMRAAWLAGVVDEARYRRHLEQLGFPGEERDVLVRLYAPAG